MPTIPDNVITAAINSQRKWNVFASVSLAQWMLESAWGRAEPPDSNNPFGIKAVGNQPFVTAFTHETLNGKYVRIPQNFAKYQSLDDAFEAHARLLATSGYYVKAQHDNNPKQFANDLTGIYATGNPGEPPYGQLLINEMDEYDLYQYDLTARQAINSMPDDLTSVKGVQMALAKLGIAPGLAVDGILGNQTIEAIKLFQQKENISVDGIVGHETIDALKRAMAS